MKRIVKVCSAVLVFSLVLGLVGCLMGGRPQHVHWNGGWLDRWHFWETKETVASVEVPQGEIRALEFELGGGELTLRSGTGFSLEVARGSLRQNKVSNGVWILENGTPDLEGARIVVTIPEDRLMDWIHLDVGAGRMDLENLHCKAADFKVGVGSIGAEHLVVEEQTNLDVSMGKLDLSGRLLGETTLECDMGEVDLELEKPEEYGYSVASSMGTVTVDGQKYNGLDTEVEIFPEAKNFYKIQCDMGSVEVEF